MYVETDILITCKKRVLSRIGDKQQGKTDIKAWGGSGADWEESRGKRVTVVPKWST